MTNDDNDLRKMSDEQLVKILVETVLRGEDVRLEADGTNASALGFLSRVAFVRDWCSICSYELNYGKKLVRFAVLDRRTSTLVLRDATIDAVEHHIDAGVIEAAELGLKEHLRDGIIKVRLSDGAIRLRHPTTWDAAVRTKHADVAEEWFREWPRAY